MRIPFPTEVRIELAGKALQGILASYEVQQDICNRDPRYQQQPDGHWNFADVVAMNAVEFADALMKQLQK